MFLLVGCAPSGETVRDESARLRASIEKFRPEYRQAIDTENRLAFETLAWLRGDAVASPRTAAASEARALMDRWAKVYFVPRWIHQSLRHDRYSSPQVRAVQSRVLQHLKQRYFELHDYQRYAQHASESAMHQAPLGYLPSQLQEFQRRLEAKAVATDELAALVAELPAAR